MTCPRPKLEEAVKKKKLAPFKKRRRKYVERMDVSRSRPHTVKATQSPIPSAQKTVPPPAPPPTTPPPPGLMIIPWGGHTIYNGSALQLINICPIDNCLMILYALTTQSAKIGSYLDNNSEIVCRTLELIRGGEIAEAKVEWMKTGCPVQVGTNGILDFWVNEETMFTQYLIPLMRSNVTPSCSSTSSPQLGVS